MNAAEARRRRTKLAVVVTSTLVVAVASARSAQTAPLVPQVIPIYTLAPAVRTAERLGSINGLRQLADGRVLVNEGVRRRAVIFDSTLTSFTVLADTAEGAATRYPAMGSFAMLPYLGDTVLIPDITSRSLLVIEPSGRVGRAMAPPRPQDIGALFSAAMAGAGGADRNGRLVYKATVPRQMVPSSAPGGSPTTVTPDSAAIVRADFDTRRVDTIAHVRIASAASPVSISVGPDGRRIVRQRMNPVAPGIDDWALLSDGSIAIVRGFDYHIDWVYSDGSRASTPKMPYDWRRLTDADKQAKIDSARRITDSLLATPTMNYRMIFPMVVNGQTRLDTVVPTFEYASIEEIPDYIPPIRAGALKPDADGNLWILPTTTLQARGGGLLYDVVNNKGVLFERVQLPKDRNVVGFGRGGVVYLMWRDGTSGVFLERTRIVRAAPTTQPQ